MTDAPGGYFPPSDRGLGNGSESYAATAAPADTSPSPATAKEQGGQTAKDSGQHLASTATDHARNVAQESRRQAKDLAREVGSQVNEQAGAQKDKATVGLRSLSGELRSMARNSEQSGPAADLAHQAADRLGDVAQWLDDREPGHLVEEVRDFARRKPGTFLIGAAVTGVVVGRLTRGAVQAARRDDAGDHTGYADAAPAATAGVPQSGSYAGERYGDDATPIATATEADVLLVDEPVSSSYGTGQGR